MVFAEAVAKPMAYYILLVKGKFPLPGVKKSLIIKPHHYKIK
jgi:hypothetical protein